MRYHEREAIDSSGSVMNAKENLTAPIRTQVLPRFLAFSVEKSTRLGAIAAEGRNVFHAVQLRGFEFGT